MVLNAKVCKACVVAVASVVMSACGSADPPETKRGPEQTELLHLQVGPTEDAIGFNVVPVDIQAPCLVPVMEGLGRFADVGWVTPRFFLVSANGGPGYTFEPLASGRVRFRAVFQAAQSEQDAVRLAGDRVRRLESVYYCNIPPTLRGLSAHTNIRRLASWPVPYMHAILSIFATKYTMAVSDTSNWTTGGPLLVSVDLTRDEHDSLVRDLRDSLGTQIEFIVSNRPPEASCTQTVHFDGLDDSAWEPFGLRDGENGAVSAQTFRQTLAGLKSRPQPETEGTCPATPDLPLNCARSGTTLRCRIDGALQRGAVNVQTHTNFGME